MASLEKQNAAPKSAAWLLEHAAAQLDSRSFTMFVLPLAPARRVVSQRAFDRLFDESLDRFFGGDSTPASRTPAMDVTESDTAYTLTFDVPGASREQLEVTVEGRRLTLATAQPAAEADKADKAGRTLYRERSAARYARTVVLPAEVDSTTSQARFDNGVLTLTLAKKVPTGAKKISVE
jgi:HSP20 family protein